jgi:hypothetical protein
MEKIMGKQHARIISKTAFEKAFVEGEMIMRRNLAILLQEEINKETNPATIVGLKKAQEIIYGKLEEKK